jgi:hypothetical protein
MYDIFVRVKDSTKYIIKKFKEFIKEEGSLIVNNEDFIGGKPKPPKEKGGKPVHNNGDPVKFTEAILALKVRCDNFITKAFKDDMLF